MINTVRFGASDVVNDPQAYTTHPIVNARFRPRISPSFPPVIINDAITSVYSVIAVWIPVIAGPDVLGDRGSRPDSSCSTPRKSSRGATTS